MDIPTLTLDTNLLHEYWKRRDKVQVVEQLLALGQKGKVDLAVTARVHEDIPQLPLAQKLNNLPELNIQETGSVTRLGYWVLGRDMLGDDAFDSYRSTAYKLAKQRGKKPPDWRDWDHLHAHYLLHREVFLTWDEGIHCLSSELKHKFGIVVMKPEEYLRTLGGDFSQ
ncbi:MAG: hypothetical protein HYX82_03270 [Chloroflexi bacterium]|nr:hypothetical protein [Chloroflexota bacterium]